MIFRRGFGEFVFFVIYVKNNVDDRLRFWDFLEFNVNGNNVLWFVVGDFNVVFKEEERYSNYNFNIGYIL